MNQKIPVWKTIRFTLGNLTQNSWMYLRNSIFLQFFISVFGFGFLTLIFRGMLFMTGQSNLNFANFKTVLLSPGSIPLLILYLLAFAFLIFMEFSILIFMIYGTIRGIHFSWRSSIQNAFSELKQLLNGHFITFWLYFLTLLPIVNIGELTFISKKITIPEFITGEITKTSAGTLFYLGLVVVLLYFHARSSLAIPLQILTDQPFTTNIITSWKLTKKNVWRLLLISAVVEGVLAILVIFISLGSAKLLQGFIILYTKIATFIVMTKIIHDNKLASLEVYHHHEEIKHKRKIVTAFALLFVTGSGVLTTLTTYRTESANDPIIIGHRGYVEEAVENSIEGIKAAKEAGANMVEMDILLTKDNQFVVMHDYNLKRLAGLNKRVQDMTLDEVRGLPIEQDDFKSHIPTFEEFFKAAKEIGMPLVIELKPHGGEPANYVDLFIAKYKELAIDNSNKVMSLDLKVMEELEAKAPEITTGFVIPIQFGGFGDAKVDFYVVEDFSYQELAVLHAQETGHEVFVWTINTDEALQKYVDSPVNGIITDQVALAKAIQQEHKTNNSLMDRFLRTLNVSIAK